MAGTKLSQEARRKIAQLIVDVGYYEELHGVVVTHSDLSELLQEVMA